MFKKLIEWSHSNYYDLPWRKKRTLYRTLVSEFMLQQTTVTSVLKHFDRFLELYPDIECLSVATEEEILVAWKGLGYYRRAKNLRKAAIDIYVFYEGVIPLKYEDLVNISGIGDYTANALLSIGMNKESYAIDANIERVLSRIFLFVEYKGKSLHERIKKSEQLQHILSKFGACSLNEALMDLGRIYCKANKVNCDECPVGENCRSYKSSDVLNFPKEKEKKKMKRYDLHLLRIMVKEKSDIMVYKKSKTEWLAGQWELPTYIIDSADVKNTQYPKLDQKQTVTLQKKIKNSIKSYITKYDIKNNLVKMNLNEFEIIFGTKNPYSFKNECEILDHLGTTCQKILLLEEA